MAHAIRITADPNAVQTVANRLQIDISEGPFTESLPEENSRPSVVEPLNGGPYQRAIVRFDDGDSLDAILQLIDQGTLHGVSWYLIEVHDCMHDKGGGACNGWTEFARVGDIQTIPPKQ